MPRIEMALVAELSIDTPGVKRATSRKSLMPLSSISAWVSAVTETGTLLRDSSRRVAVTTISCSGCSGSLAPWVPAAAPEPVASSARSTPSGSSATAINASTPATIVECLDVCMCVILPLSLSSRFL